MSGLKAVSVRVLAAITVALTLLGPMALDTRAATGVIGPYAQPWASCFSSHILVSVPIMEPGATKPVTYGSSNIGTQKVAFRADLYQLWQGQWRVYRYGTWWTKFVGAADQYGISVGGSWTTLDGRPMSGAIGFDRLAIGASRQAPIKYAVLFNLYWYPDASHYEGTQAVWAWHQDQRGSAQGTGIVDQTAWYTCNYPGPNYLTT
jgi:hypothetical protein